MKLGIDPGHGGTNTGTNEHGLIEKQVTRALAEQLRHSMPWDTVEPTLLRENDETASQADRGQRSRMARCDWVISIHVNANVDLNAHGAECYILPGDSAARIISRSILDAVPIPLASMKIIEADPDVFGPWIKNPRAILNAHACPTILFEVGYASHPDDLAAILSKWGQMALVSAMRVGVARMMEMGAADGRQA